MPGAPFARRLLLPLVLSGLWVAGPQAAPPADDSAAVIPAPVPAPGPAPIPDQPSAPPTAVVPAGPVEVFRPDGSRQCEAGSGVPLAAMVAELTAAGVLVLDQRTGNDGVMRIAVCGAPTGSIHIFRIGAAGLATALAMGFRPLTGPVP